MKRMTEEVLTEAERKGSTPWLLRGLVVLFISVLGLLVIQTLPMTHPNGWMPTAVLATALGLLIAALIEVFRAR